MTFLDASVLVASEDSADQNHVAAVALLSIGDLQTLDLALYEITNVVAANWRRPAAAERLRRFVWGFDAEGDLLRVDRQLIERAGQIAVEFEISAYDAAYVAAAERAGQPLASCDIRDLVSKGLAITPAEMLNRLRADPGAPAVP